MILYNQLGIAVVYCLQSTSAVDVLLFHEIGIGCDLKACSNHFRFSMCVFRSFTDDIFSLVCTNYRWHGTEVQQVWLWQRILSKSCSYNLQ